MIDLVLVNTSAQFWLACGPEPFLHSLKILKSCLHSLEYILTKTNYTKKYKKYTAGSLEAYNFDYPFWYS